MKPLTKKQIENQELITSKFSNVEVISDDPDPDYYALRFDNGKTHAMLNEVYCVLLGKRGKITFKAASRIFAKRPHEKVIASLAGYELGRRFAVKFWPRA